MEWLYIYYRHYGFGHRVTEPSLHEEQQVQYEEQCIRSKTDEQAIKLQLEKRVLFVKQLSIQTQRRESESRDGVFVRVYARAHTHTTCVTRCEPRSETDIWRARRIQND